MAFGGIRHSLQRSGFDNPPDVARVLGVLYIAGGLMVLLSLVEPHPHDVVSAGLYGIVAVGFCGGTAMLIWAEHARRWMVHAILAAGTTFISLCVVFAGVAASIYSLMFVWIVLVAGAFFPGRAVVAHVGWVIVSWGLALTLVEETSGFSTQTRWSLGSLVLVVTALVMSEIVVGRRSTEERLRTEIAEKERLESELEHLAHHDPLTGLANRRLFESELSRELARAARHNRPLGLLALDLDRFKEYNDEHGHIAGDKLLRRVAAAWERALRAEDVIARIGGDEFVVLLPDCPPAEAERVAERLRILARVDCSTGIANWDGQESLEHLLTRADRAMYETKKAGLPSVRRLRV